MATVPRNAAHSGAWGFLAVRGGLLLMLFAGGLVSGTVAAAQEGDKPKPDPVTRLVPLPSPLNDESLGLVRRTTLELQDIANREGREAFLILEISSGVSEFHHAYAIAEFLTAEPLPNLKTIAWVPATATGANVFVALSCHEIVLHPDAELGDMGRGGALPAEQQAIVRGVVAKRRNQKVTEPLAQSLMDPNASLVQLTIEGEAGKKETRLATAEEARRLRDQGTVITETRTISEAGTPALIDGREARTFDILAVRTAQSRRELVEAYGLSLDNLKELAPAQELGNIAYIELHDEIDEVFAAFAQRQIERAVVSGATLIIFEVDSPGGLLWVCQDLSMLISGLSERGIKTVAYIPKQAYSGGAILSVACDEIYMTPGATIGNAIPINMMGGIVVHAEEKVLSGETKMLRDLAGMKDRPPALLEAFADKDLEVFEVTHKTTGRKWYMSADEIHQQADEWVQGPRVPESRPGIALTVDGKRAHELLLAKPPVRDLDELKGRLGIPLDHRFQTVGRTWVDSLVFYLNNRFVTGFLLFLAIVFLYIEVATMTGLFGILAAVGFAIFFWSRMLGGTATGLEIALFVLGLGCLALEFFVIPGFGVFGITGILLVLSSLIMASQTFTGFSLEYDLMRAGQTFVTLGAAIVAVIVASMFLSQHLHRLPMLNNLVLTPPGNAPDSDDGPRLRHDSSVGDSPLVGVVGTAVTVLRPSGKARLNGTLVDVVSDGTFIEQGAGIEVVQVQRNRIVVRQV